MAKVSEVYAGDYVTAAELGPQRRTAGIFAAVEEEVGQNRERKIVLSLTSDRGQPWPRRVVLNKTNSLRLSAAYGDESNAWVGKRLEIWAEAVQFQGKLVQGLHVEPSLSAPATAPAPAAVALPPPAPQSSPPPRGNGSIPPPGPVTYPPPAAVAPAADDLDDEIPF